MLVVELCAFSVLSMNPDFHPEEAGSISLCYVTDQHTEVREKPRNLTRVT